MYAVQPDAVTIRAATSDDLNTVVELLHANGLPDDGLAAHIDHVLVAENASEIVGSAGLELYGTSALLRSVSVRPALQGTGLGQRLTRAALDKARQYAVEQVFLLTETAIDFFPRFGFQPTTRDNVPPAVKQSIEFVSACPDSAVVMVTKL